MATLGTSPTTELFAERTIFICQLQHPLQCRLTEIEHSSGRKQHFSVLAGGRVKDTPGQRLMRPLHSCLLSPLARVLLGVQKAYPGPPRVQAELDVFNSAVPASASLHHQDTTPRPGLFFWAALNPIHYFWIWKKERVKRQKKKKLPQEVLSGCQINHSFLLSEEFHCLGPQYKQGRQKWLHSLKIWPPGRKYYLYGILHPCSGHGLLYFSLLP